MAVSLAAKLSSASGNQLSFGSDSGLYAPAVGAALSNTVGWTIDNAFGASGVTWWYQLTQYSNVVLTPPANTAQVWPFQVARSCRLTDAQISVQTAGAASAFNVALYSSTGAHRGPASKVTDLLRFPTTATGIVRASVIDTTTVLAAQTLYWAASWVSTTSAYPAILARNTAQSFLRLVDAPVTVQPPFGGSGLVFTDGSVAWSGLTSAPASMSAAGQLTAAQSQATVNTSPPQIQWALANV